MLCYTFQGSNTSLFKLLIFFALQFSLGIISRPNNSTSRDPANDGKESILTLKEFLNLSKIYTNTGLYVNVQVVFFSIKCLVAKDPQ